MISEKDKALLRKFGAHVKEIRTTKGWTLQQVEANGKLDNSDLSKIERGETNVTFTTINKLAEALEVHPIDLFKYS